MSKKKHVSKTDIKRLVNRLSQADVEALNDYMQRQLEKAVSETVNECYQRHWAITMRVLRDRFGWGRVRLRRLWDEAMSYLDDIDEGRLKTEEVLQSLYDEDSIRITWRYEPKQKEETE